MPSTTTSKRYRRGQVVVVNVPFSDQTGSKLRPALIVSDERFHRALPDVIVCPVSDPAFAAFEHGEVRLRHLQACGRLHLAQALSEAPAPEVSEVHDIKLSHFL